MSRASWKAASKLKEIPHPRIRRDKSRCEERYRREDPHEYTKFLKNLPRRQSVPLPSQFRARMEYDEAASGRSRTADTETRILDTRVEIAFFFPRCERGGRIRERIHGPPKFDVDIGARVSLENGQP